MVTTIPQLRKWADALCENTIFLHSYATNQRTYGQRRAYIQYKLIETFGSDAYRCDIYDREQLRRYFDVLCSVEPDPNDATYDKYDGVLQMLPLPTLQPKKAKSIMDRNLAALLRADAKTVHVKLPASAADNTPRKARTYVSHLPLAMGDSVVVMAANEIKIGVIEYVDDEVKIEPGCETEFFWIIDKVDMAAHDANEKRNAEIVAEAAVIVRNNMRKSFAQQVLGAASDDQRAKLLRLTGNAA